MTKGVLDGLINVIAILNILHSHVVGLAGDALVFEIKTNVISIVF